MIYFNFLFENFKQNRGVSSIIKKKKSILIWTVALIAICIILFFFTTLDFSQLLVVPAQSIIPSIETNWVDCEMTSKVRINFRIYNEDGITNEEADYNINVYRNGVLTSQHNRDITASVGDDITFIAVSKNNDYEDINFNMIVPCRYQITQVFYEMKKEIVKFPILMVVYDINKYAGHTDLTADYNINEI